MGGGAGGEDDWVADDATRYVFFCLYFFYFTHLYYHKQTFSTPNSTRFYTNCLFLHQLPVFTPTAHFLHQPPFFFTNCLFFTPSALSYPGYPFQGAQTMKLCFVVCAQGKFFIYFMCSMILTALSRTTYGPFSTPSSPFMCQLPIFCTNHPFFFTNRPFFTPSALSYPGYPFQGAQMTKQSFVV